MYTSESLIAATSWAAIYGWWANHKTPCWTAAIPWAAIIACISWSISASRDRNKRKYEFLEFLGHWRSEIERIDPKNIQAIYEVYITGVHRFHGYLAKLRNDFKSDDTFKETCHALGSIRYEEFPAAPDCRDIVCSKIDILKGCW